MILINRRAAFWIILVLSSSLVSFVGAFQSYLDSLNPRKTNKSPSIENLKNPPPPEPAINNNYASSSNNNNKDEGSGPSSGIQNFDNNGKKGQQPSPVTTAPTTANGVSPLPQQQQQQQVQDSPYMEYMKLRREQAAANANNNSPSYDRSMTNNNNNNTGDGTARSLPWLRTASDNNSNNGQVSSSPSLSPPPAQDNKNNGMPAAWSKNSANSNGQSVSTATSFQGYSPPSPYNNNNHHPGPFQKTSFQGYTPPMPLPPKDNEAGAEIPLPQPQLESQIPHLTRNENFADVSGEFPLDVSSNFPLANVDQEQQEDSGLAIKTQKKKARISTSKSFGLLDSMVDKQLEALDNGQEWVNDLVGDYTTLLKKHARLAITGGVPLNREMTNERFAPALDTMGMTERIIKAMDAAKMIKPGASSSTWEAFLKAEDDWAMLREYMPYNSDEEPPFPFVTEEGGMGNPKCYAKLHHQRARSLDYDVAVCGGTLGIFFAMALQLKGYNVVVVEKDGKLEGPDQEWNISMDELLQLQALGIITQADMDAAIQTEFAGCRSAFKNKEVPIANGYLDNGVGYETFTEDVMNIGVSPKILIARVAKRFQSLGGIIQENKPLEGVCVIKDVGASLDFGDLEEPITANLVIDAMGSNSPITRQQRYGKKPDGVSVVVGTCAAGYDPKTNLIGDAIYTNSAIQDKGENGGRMQYFWTSFPVGIGRNGKQTSDVKTTYLFTMIDAHQRRPTLETLFEDYWRLLPQYQPSIEDPELDLDVQRVLFAFFPTYKDSPLQPKFHRILAVGDASGIQSPLSFGGFGVFTRHLGRITSAVTEALDANLLTRHDLAQINPYNPSLSASWMMQKAMSVRMGQPFVDKRFINRLLATNLEVMDSQGPRGGGDTGSAVKPFLQNVNRFEGLMGTVAKSFVSDPTLVPQLIAWVGLPALVDWMGHVSMMGMYSALDNYVAPWLGPIGNSALRKDRSRYQFNRQLDSWKYGSGDDFNI